MQTPSTSDTVRVDAGFIVGDEVSSHYDPMIAKLIVRGHDRRIAIQKLHAALEQYEVAGLVTNIEFLKAVCNHPSFVAAEVETGFISKHSDKLFAERIPTPEVYAQAALGLLFIEAAASQEEGTPLFGIPQSGFGTTAQRRSWGLQPEKTLSPGEMVGQSVTIDILDTGLFDVTIDGTPFVYRSVASSWDSQTRKVTSFLPHTRLETRVIDDSGNLTLFQQGELFRLRCATPKWVEKALGIRDTAHSVLAPMPCKVLRVEAKAGDRVKKDQVLVVIESMKMETVIRSPQDGVISRVVHQQGVGAFLASKMIMLTLRQDLCKAGTALVEFEELLEPR